MGPRFSGTTAFRNPTYASSAARFAANRTTTAFNSESYSAARARFAAHRTGGARTLALNSANFNNGREVARYGANWHRNWDRRRDHFWHGRRCHFHNNVWIIYEPFFYYPYAYGYGYPFPYYSSYYGTSDYDDGYYNNSSAATEYSQDPDANQPEYENTSRVSDVQSALSREGYYDGPVNGRLGTATRNALRRYQRDHGLQVTGTISRAVIEALRLR